MAKRFQDKVVWITGGGSGIGRAMAMEFARAGATVVVSGRRLDRLQEVCRDLESAGGKSLAVACDVTDDDDVARSANEIAEKLGGIDVTVANAGFGIMGRIEDLTAADWRRQFETNVIGLASTVRASLPHLRKRQGRIVLMGSVAGFVAAPGTGAYTASKYAVRSIGQTLAMELHGSGVSCTTIHPGFVASEIAQVDNEGRFDASRVDKRPAGLMWPAEKAARVIVDAVYDRRREFVFTAHGRFGAWVGLHLSGVAHFVMTRSAAKKSAKRFAKPGVGG